MERLIEEENGHISEIHMNSKLISEIVGKAFDKEII